MPTSLNPTAVALLAALALVAAPPLWGATRHVVTLVHEAGHAIVALATGRRLNAITLHSDTSGLTVSSGRPRGPGMIATASAGYLAPSLLGFGALALVEAGHTPWALGSMLVVLAGMLVFIRNGWGLVVVGLSGIAVAVLTYRAPESVQDFAAQTLAWVLLVAAPRTALDLWGHRRRMRTRTTDADVLARLTPVPAAVWNLLFLVSTVAALAGGLWLVGWIDVLP